MFGMQTSRALGSPADLPGLREVLTAEVRDVALVFLPHLPFIIKINSIFHEELSGCLLTRYLKEPNYKSLRIKYKCENKTEEDNQLPFVH